MNRSLWQVVVQSGGYIKYKFVVTEAMTETSLNGSFNASGGLGNDIQAAVTDEIGMTNWTNGHQAQVFWSTPGKQTSGKFEVKLRPGTYYLILNNKFSMFTNKYVFLDADLKWRRQVL